MPSHFDLLGRTSSLRLTSLVGCTPCFVTRTPTRLSWSIPNEFVSVEHTYPSALVNSNSPHFLKGSRTRFAGKCISLDTVHTSSSSFYLEARPPKLGNHSYVFSGRKLLIVLANTSVHLLESKSIYRYLMCSLAGMYTFAVEHTRSTYTFGYG